MQFKLMIELNDNGQLKTKSLIFDGLFDAQSQALTAFEAYTTRLRPESLLKPLRIRVIRQKNWYDDYDVIELKQFKTESWINNG